MFVNFISSSIVDSRLDSNFYNPEYLQDVVKLLPFHRITLEKIRHKNSVISYGILKPEEVEYSDSIMIRIKDFQDPFIDIYNSTRISIEQHKAYLRTECQPGDILIAIGGYLGRIGIVPFENNGVKNININRHIARLSVDKKNGINKYFLLGFFLSNFGGNLLKRYVSGSVQAGINLEDLRQIQIIKPHLDCQNYIGDKIRQAEKLRAIAQGLEQKVNDFHQKFLPKTGYESKRCNFHQVSDHVLNERLDAEHYPYQVASYLQRISTGFSLYNLDTSIVLDVFNGMTLPETHLGNEASCFQATVASLSSNFLKDKLRIVKRPKKSEKKLMDCDLLICATAHDPVFIGRNITFASVKDKDIYPSTEVLTVRVNRNILPASYLRTWLSSEIGYLQIQSCVRGISAHLYPEDVMKIQVAIPCLDEQDKTTWFACDEMLLDASDMVNFSNALITAARYLVEALIEQKITETELIEAYKNPDKDRQILSKLKTDGYDGQGEPLFPDLEALFDILKQTSAEGEATQ